MHLKTQVRGIKIGTDINKVKVPDRLRIRQNVGIDWINEALGGGGMTPSTVGMVTGSPGCGKSTLLRQLADSITAQGHIALYNTGEESVYQVKMRCEDMDLTHGFQVGQETMLSVVLDHAKHLQKENPGRQVFVLQDSLQTLDDGHYKNGTTSMTPVRCASELTDWAKETYGIVLFIGQVTKAGVFAGKNTIRHMIDVHCEILKDEDSRSETFGKLVFSVSKNRFGFTGKSYLVELGKSGLSILGDVSGYERDEVEEDDRPRYSRTRSGFAPKVDQQTSDGTSDQ